MQPFRKGHQFNSKAMRRKLERKQRQQAKKLLAAGGVRGGAKKKPKQGPKQAPPVGAYPCGPKMMTLGEAFR